MNRRWLQNLVLLMVALHGLAAQAQVWPKSGLWWQAGGNGKFMQVHIGPTGYALVTLSFAQSGQPSYRVLQGQLESFPASLAALQSPLYRIDNAGCLDCFDDRGRTVAEDPAMHTLVFANATTAKLVLPSGVEIEYQPLPLITGVEETLAARFASNPFFLQVQERAVQIRPAVLPQLPAVCEYRIPPTATIIDFDFSADELNRERIPTQVQRLLLAIEAGASPRAWLLDASSLDPDPAEAKCHIQIACPPPHPSCNVVAYLSETATGLIGYYNRPPAQEIGLLRLTPLE